MDYIYTRNRYGFYALHLIAIVIDLFNVHIMPLPDLKLVVYATSECMNIILYKMDWKINFSVIFVI